MTVFKIGRWNN